MPATPSAEELTDLADPLLYRCHLRGFQNSAPEQVASGFCPPRRPAQNIPGDRNSTATPSVKVTLSRREYASARQVAARFQVRCCSDTSPSSACQHGIPRTSHIATWSDPGAAREPCAHRGRDLPNWHPKPSPAVFDLNSLGLTL